MTTVTLNSDNHDNALNKIDHARGLAEMVGNVFDQVRRSLPEGESLPDGAHVLPSLIASLLEEADGLLQAQAA